jgi:hypothetical protein
LIARRQILGHLIPARMLGWGVSRVGAPANGSGSIGLDAPTRRDPFRRDLELIQILLGGPQIVTGENDPTIDQARAIASRIAHTDEEADLLLEWLQVRAEHTIRDPKVQDLADRFVDRLLESGGEMVLDLPAERDSSPLIEIHPPAVTVNFDRADSGGPVINVLPAPVNNEINVQAPDKLVTFSRDSDGNIVEAETSAAPVAA